jgi:hypothetical protein
VALLETLLAQALDRAWTSNDLTAPLLAALPASVAAPLVVQRLAEKTLASVRRHTLQELDVILGEYGLGAKIAEVEFLAARGGLLLDDIDGGSGVAAPTAGLLEQPRPEQALKSMLAAARRAEAARLLAINEQLEAENEALQQQMEQQARKLKPAQDAVERTKQHTDAVFAALNTV